MSAARQGRLGHADAFALVALLSFLVARYLPSLAPPWACPLRTLAHVPCASCGMTHAFVFLARGDVRGALAASPLGAILAAGAWAYAALDLARLALGLRWPLLPRGVPRAAAAVAFAALLVNWAWLVAREVGP